MNKRSLDQYDLESLRQALPRKYSETFIGFTPWRDDFEGWERSPKEFFPETPERTVTRTIWDNSKDRDERILIEVAECASAEKALKALEDRLDWNQLPKLESGPKGLGYASFVHPEDVPPAVFFIRGNLCVSVVSFGRKAVEVNELARSINARLENRPRTEKTSISLSIGDPRLKAGGESVLKYSLPWRYGEEGYVTFFVSGGVLSLKEKTLFISSDEPGKLTVEAYILEPGREPHAGRLTVSVE